VRKEEAMERYGNLEVWKLEGIEAGSLLTSEPASPRRANMLACKPASW
jgi:hypothetical protein